MEKTALKNYKRTRRHARIRARVTGTAERPRLAIFRSNRAVYAQLIDDERGATIAAVDTRAQKGATLRDRSAAVGTAIATLAKGKGVEKVVFDRGGFQYQGVIATLADSARAAGLVF